MAHISDPSERESRLRSVFKAITYRITGTITTALIVLGVTGNFEIAFAVGAIEPLVKFFVYYLHERAWQLVPNGAVRNWFRRGAA
jgi:uncharacterized membrane protein